MNLLRQLYYQWYDEIIAEQQVANDLMERLNNLKSRSDKESTRYRIKKLSKLIDRQITRIEIQRSKLRWMDSLAIEESRIKGFSFRPSPEIFVLTNLECHSLTIMSNFK